MPPRIYSPRTLSENEEITLDKTASTHLLKVLRMRAGDRLIAFNGDGFDYPAEIVSAGKHAVISIDGRRENHSESPLRITVAQGISRGDRMDYTIQKSVELGAHAFQPLITKRSTVRLDPERAEKKLRHWQSIAISACEQCGRSVIPAIAAPLTLRGWIASTGADGCLLVLDPAAPRSLSSIGVGESCTVIIGPESGLSEDEMNELTSSGAHSVAVGPRVLRTETAASVALAVLQSQHGDFR